MIWDCADLRHLWPHQHVAWFNMFCSKYPECPEVVWVRVRVRPRATPWGVSGIGFGFGFGLATAQRGVGFGFRFGLGVRVRVRGFKCDHGRIQYWNTGDLRKVAVSQIHPHYWTKISWGVPKRSVSLTWPECSITCALGFLESFVERRSGSRSATCFWRAKHAYCYMRSPVHPIYLKHTWHTYMRPRMNYIALSSMYIAACYLALLYITLRYIALLDIIYLTLPRLTLPHLTLHYSTLYSAYITWHCLALPYLSLHYLLPNRRKFRSQTSDNMDRWKAEMGRVREEKRRRKKIRKRKSQKIEDGGARKGRKVAKHCVFSNDLWLLKRRVRSQLAKWEMKKCTPLWRKAHFEVKMYKTPHVRTTFGRWSVVLRGRRKGLCTLLTVSKRWGFCSMSKNDGRRGTLEEDLQRYMFRGRHNTRDMFIRDVRRSGRWFPERGCILEHQIFSFGEMILRDRCSTSYDLASLFRGRRSTLDR